MDKLGKQFHQALVDAYQAAKKEAKYNATRFFQMLSEHGGLDTARILLHAPGVSEGYTKLFEKQRLDLRVEYIVLQPQWRDLFTSEELDIARRRLKAYGLEVDL
jgi:hypothetical protein